jgi:hypothetical protein
MPPRSSSISFASLTSAAALLASGFEVSPIVWTAKKARLRIFVEPKKAGQRRVDDVDNAPCPTNHKPRKIGVKINRNAIGKHAAPVEWYIHNLAYFAVRAIGAVIGR